MRPPEVTYLGTYWIEYGTLFHGEFTIGYQKEKLEL